MPLNLMRGENPTADYAVTGTWSTKAVKEAQKYLTANEVGEGEEREGEGEVNVCVYCGWGGGGMS